MVHTDFNRYIEFNLKKETSMNAKKTIQLNSKIKLLVTDPPLALAPSETPVTQLDADKLLKDLPVDEFFDALDEASSEQLQTLVAGFENKNSSEENVQGLFDVPAEPRTAQDIFVWWEFRRLSFNVIVGAVGVVFLLYLAFFPVFCGALFLAIIYAAFANMCYSSGAPLELFIRTCTSSCFQKAYPPFGPLLLKFLIGAFVFITVCGGLLLCIFPNGGI